MILVTGATGFVGSEVVRRASLRGWRVRGLARRPHLAPTLGRLPHVELFRGSATDPGDLQQAMENVTTVLHLVGIIVQTREQSFHDAHVEATRAVLEAAERAGVSRFVHMSALGVEAGRHVSEYYRTKWQGEELVRASPLDTTIFRPSLVFGPEDDFFNRFAKIARWSPVVPLPLGGRTRFQPVWVGDVAECFLQAGRMSHAPEPVYDLAGPEVLTLAEVVRAVQRMTGRPRPTPTVPASLLRLVATVGERVLPRPPVTVDQLKMMALDNVSNSTALGVLLRDFEIEHAGIEDKAAEWLAPSSGGTR